MRKAAVFLRYIRSNRVYFHLLCSLLTINRLTYEEIAAVVGLSVDDVKALDGQKTA